MDKEEAILTLRKNKLDIEHQALLQDREVILIAMTGIPITAVNVIISAQWYTHPNLTGVLIASAVLIGAAEYLRRIKSRQLAQKRQEIDRFISELNQPPHG